MKYGCFDSAAEWLPNVALTDATYPNATACGYYFIPNKPDSFPLLMNEYVVDEKTNPGEALSMKIFPFLDVYTRMHFKVFQTPIIDFLIASTKDGHNGILGQRNYNRTRVCILLVHENYSIRILLGTPTGER